MPPLRPTISKAKFDPEGADEAMLLGRREDGGGLCFLYCSITSGICTGVLGCLEHAGRGRAAASIGAAGRLLQASTRGRRPFGVKVILAVDKTDKIEIRRLQYCPANKPSRLEAAVRVRCKTSDAASVKLSLEEEFDFELTVRNDDCGIEAFRVAPRGEIGRLVERIAGLSGRIKNAAAQHIRVLCK